MGEPKLTDTPQALKIGMFNEVKNQVVGNADEAVNRIVKYFSFIRGI